VRAFGNRGTYSTRLAAGPAKALGMVRQADGKLVVVGSVGRRGDESQDAFIARFYPDGTLDGDFANGGIRTVDLDARAEAANDVAALPGGGFAIVGTFTTDREAPFIARVRGDGSVESVTLPATGPAPEYATADAVAVGGDGTVFVGGNAGNNFRPAAHSLPYVARLSPGGAISIRPGEQQADVRYLPDPVATLADLAVDRTRGRLYLAGSSHAEDSGQERMWAAALTTDLTVASSYGRGGVATADFPDTEADEAESALVDRRGRAVLAGVAGPDFAVARFTRRGRLDRTFGRRGLARVRFRQRKSVARELIEQADGHLLLAGTAGGNVAFPLRGTGRTVALVRLDGD
jgi:uncharacterized delta-60 repeat protein